MRLCVFCGNSANSREDAWPRWLLKALPTGRVSMEFFTDTIPHLKWKSSDGTTKVRTVCACCNNGWMSQLESASMGMVAALIKGETTSVSGSQAAQLAAWASKTVLVFDSMRENRFFTDDECAHVRANLAPPPAMLVAMGMADAPSPKRRVALNLMELHDTPVRVRICMGFLKIGRLLVFFFSPKYEPRGESPVVKYSAKFRLSGEPPLNVIWPWGFDDQQIPWPWPPAFQLSKQAAERIIAEIPGLFPTQ